MQLAARVCAEAQPDQIVVTGVMRDLCTDQPLLGSFQDIGRATLKGFVSAVQLYALPWQEDVGPTQE